jgi:hypothetical protein
MSGFADIGIGNNHQFFTADGFGFIGELIQSAGAEYELGCKFNGSNHFDFSS